MAPRGPRMVNLALALATTRRLPVRAVRAAAPAQSRCRRASSRPRFSLGWPSPQDVADRAQRACVRGREVRPHQDVRQPRRHDADVVRRPAHEGAQLRGPRAPVDRGGPRLPREAVRVRLLHARRSDRRHPAGLRRRPARSTRAPRPTGGLDENCIVGSRISRLTVAGETMTLRAGAGGGLLPAVRGARRGRPRLRRGRQPVRDRRRRLDRRRSGTTARPAPRRTRAVTRADRTPRLRPRRPGACARRTCARPATRRASTAR